MTTKIFRSKIGFEILIPLMLILGSLTDLLISQKAWVGLIVMVIAIVFISSIYLNTSYQLTSGQELVIRCGFFKYTITIVSITKIRFVRNPLSAPALSIDRLEISYKRYDTILISPVDKQDFIQSILKINPAIKVELSTANPP